MHAVVYRWKVDPSREDEFRRGWRELTDAIRAGCGSLGSRLHRTDDGYWVAYALWPSRDAWAACSPPDERAAELMNGAVDDADEPLHLTVVDDRLAP